jgi:hypothetical protein
VSCQALLDRREPKLKEQRDSLCVIELDRLLGMNIQMRIE